MYCDLNGLVWKEFRSAFVSQSEFSLGVQQETVLYIPFFRGADQPPPWRNWLARSAVNRKTSDECTVLQVLFTHSSKMKYDSLRKSDPNYKKLSLAAKQQKYCEAVQEVMTPIIESVKPLHSLKVWEDISPQFLVTFWSLTMYDLQVPVESYQKEINKIKQASLQAVDSKEMTTSKGKKEQERFNALMEKLQDERKKQQEHVEKVMARLRLEKDSWFPTKSLRSPKNESIMKFLQLCVFPRCIFTSTDALYCSKFIHTIHMLKTANFSTLLCLDKLLCDLTYTVTLCTENEAHRYGRFLCCVLELVMRWHGDVTIFEAECSKHPGFITKYRASNHFSDANDEVSYENYRHVCHKWHYKITKAILVCLESKDYTQIRNSLIVLIKILPHFPMLVKLAQIIEKAIEKVQQEEKNQRQDLYILAMSYGGHLKAKAPTMVKDSDFHQVISKTSTKQPKEKKESSTERVEKIEKKEKSTSRSESKENEKSRSNRRETTETRREPTPVYENTNKNKSDKDDMKEEVRLPKEEKSRTKDRKEDKHTREDRSYRDERYIEPMPLSKDEQRYTAGYYSGTGHYMDEAKDISSLSNSSSGSHKHGGDNEPDRDVKRRKLDGGSSSKIVRETKEGPQNHRWKIDKDGLNSPERL
ncbi:hypothetical protein RUM43_006609 [Polyplax serrata]|uniref:THO complex subunitTHOC2 C-terminal domain-containing protein n=1 Tax=Polyplax serrata TaxID=468196 RepID=A0AAN8NTL6_POLSC